MMPTLGSRLSQIYKDMQQDKESYIHDLIEAYEPLFKPKYAIPFEKVKEPAGEQSVTVIEKSARKKRGRKKKQQKDEDAIINEKDSEFFI